MPQLILDNASLHYQVTGDPSRPWLIFSNSLGADLSMWELQAAAFSRFFAVLRYDTRGLGQSSVTPGPYNVAQHVKDVLALADHVGAHRFHLCGLSMGGLVGQWLALHAPQRLEKLVLSNTAAKIGTADGWNERIAIVQSNGIAPIVETGLQRWFTPSFFHQFPETVQRFRSVLLATNPEGYVANSAVVRDADFRSQIHTISVPTLVICATHDPVTTVADAIVLTQSIPDAQMLELNAAHLSNVEQAEAFNRALLDFL